MNKFYGKIKIKGVDITIAHNEITIFDKENNVEKEDSWKMCEYLVHEGYFYKKDLIRINIIRPMIKTI
jgi:hypothetical protein